MILFRSKFLAKDELTFASRCGINHLYSKSRIDKKVLSEIRNILEKAIFTKLKKFFFLKGGEISWSESEEIDPSY